MYVYAHLVAVVHGGQKRMLDSLELKLQVVVSCLTWVLGSNLHPLEEGYTFLTTESSLLPHIKNFKKRFKVIIGYIIIKVQPGPMRPCLPQQTKQNKASLKVTNHFILRY